MSEIITKVERSSEIAHDLSLIAWQRIGPALENLSGLLLSDLDCTAKEAVDAQLSHLYQKLATYDIEVEADFEKLTESDALDVLRGIDAVRQICIDSETGRVMKALDTAGQKLPVAAIKEVREHRDLFIPLLTRTLEQAIHRVRNGGEWDGQAPFFALFLLTEMEATEAFSLLLEMLRLSDDGAFKIFGDGVHELVPPMLALFARDNMEEIGKIVQDTSIDMYVRWSTAGTYKHLVRDKAISRQVAIDVLQKHFEHSVESEDYDLLAPLICELGDLAAETALETIRSAYQRNLVDDSVVDLDFFESQIAGGEETVARELGYCRPTGMPDTIAELEQWASFREKPPRPKREAKLDPPSAPVPRPHLASSDVSQRQTVTIVRSDLKVGRNDPCPCGSGKKYKKCCR